MDKSLQLLGEEQVLQWLGPMVRVSLVLYGTMELSIFAFAPAMNESSSYSFLPGFGLVSGPDFGHSNTCVVVVSPGCYHFISLVTNDGRHLL